MENTASKITHFNITGGFWHTNMEGGGRGETFQNIIGEKKDNQNITRLIKLCKIFQLKLKSTFFKKLPRKGKDTDIYKLNAKGVQVRSYCYFSKQYSRNNGCKNDKKKEIWLWSLP